MRAVLRGRSQALASAITHLRTTQTSGRSRVLWITGEPGIGKSAVIDALVAHAAGSGFRIGYGQIGVDPLPPAATLLLALASSTPALVPTSELKRLASLVPDATLLTEVLREHLATTSSEAPLLIALDDRHLLDETSQAVLTGLITCLADQPVAWVFTGPTSQDNSVPGADASTQRLFLPPLTPEDVEAIAFDRLGHQPSEPILRMLKGISGNPQLAVRLLEGIERARDRGETEDQVPGEFILAVRHQLETFDAETREIIYWAAVLATPFTIAAMAALTGRGPASVRADMERTRANGLLKEDSGETSFRHELVREVIYSGMLAQEQQRLHRGCARYLLNVEHSALAGAEHAQSGAHAGDVEAAVFLRQAADEVLPTDAEAAGGLMLDALSLLRPGQSEWLDFAEHCVEVLLRSEQYAEAVRIADTALARVDDSATSARLQLLVAPARWLLNRSPELVSKLEATLTADSLPPLLGARLAAFRALALSTIPACAQASQAVANALRMASSSADDEAMSVALLAAGQMAGGSGDHRGAVAHYRNFRIQAGTTPRAEEIVELQYLDRFAEAEGLLRHAENQPHPLLPQTPASLTWARMLLEFNLSRFADAEILAERLSLADLDQERAPFGSDACLVLVTAALVRGDLELASQRLASPTATHPVTDPPSDNRRLVTAWLTAARGSALAAAAMLTRGRDEPLAMVGCPPGGIWLMAHIARAAEDSDLMRQVVALSSDVAAENPDGTSYSGTAMLVRGISSQDLGLLRGADEILSTGPRPDLRAGAAADLGRTLMAQGCTTEAINHLERAWNVYQQIGARRALTSIQRTMRRAGVRRAKWETSGGRPRTGWEALTRTELKVAVLISAGHTNRFVARQFQVSPNTIGTHLRSIFAKLNVQSRVQLANAYNSRPPDPEPSVISASPFESNREPPRTALSRS